MAIINTTDLDFNGEEIKALSEAVFESAFAKPEVSQFHNVVTGIVAKKQIAIMGRLSGLVGAGDGGCDPATGANTITNSQKFWNPEVISDRLSACWTDLQGTFFIWGLKYGIEKSDLTGSDFLNFVEELLTDAIWEAIYRFAWFGDTDAADVDASPAGVLTSGTNPLYFNRINGFWKQIFAIVAADASRLTSGLTSRNGQATYALQAFTTTDTTNKVVSTTLQDMKFGADLRLRADASKVFIVTQSVADQYERELIQYNVAYTTERLENGVMMLKSGGITLFTFDFWDRMIESYYDNGTKYYIPHRIVLISPENLQIGAEDQGALISLDVHFDRVTKKNYIDFAFSIDAKLILDYAVQVAY